MPPTDKPAATENGEPKCPTCGTDTSWSKGWPCWDTWHDAEPTPPVNQPVTLDRETFEKWQAALLASVSALKAVALYNASARDGWRLPVNIMRMVAHVQHRLDEVNFDEL